MHTAKLTARAARRLAAVTVSVQFAMPDIRAEVLNGSVVGIQQ